ncbi:hypothetical protein HD557_002641 [Nocardioides luteus]|nr:hypothetical protein [Nocardioides luteus]
MYENIDRFLDGPPPGASERELVDWIARLEAVKCRAEAVQAEASVRLEEAARVRQAEAGAPARKLGEGVASQIALARRVSPDRGAKLLGLAKVLLIEMPHTFGLMKAGLFSQWQATILARETACLSLEDRRVIDHELCAPGPSGQPAKAAAMGLRQLENAAKKLAITLDQASVVARAASAEKDRRVSLRPAPDTMTWLGALLPVKDGVAVFAALDQAANAARAAGDERTRGQVMADTLVDRVTGRSSAGAKPRIEVKIVMTADALTNDSDQSAMVEGYGPVPAAWAREELADAEVFVRRLFTDPAGQLVAMESRSRKAPDGLAEFVITRDGGICRTVGCDARSATSTTSSVTPMAEKPAPRTCRACANDATRRKKPSAGKPDPDPDGSITTITPTGHTYVSPPPEHWQPHPSPLSRAEFTLRDVLLDHTLAA